MKMTLRARKSLEDLLEEGLESASQGWTFYRPSGVAGSDIKEIDDLLKVAQLVKKVVAVDPDPRSRAAIRYRLLACAEAQPRGPLPGLVSLFWLRMPLALALAVFAVLLFFSAPAAALAAARDALPGEPLYPVKEAWENIQLMLARSDEAKAGTYARLALRLTEDLSELDQTGKPIPQETVWTLTSHTDQAVSAIEKEDKPATIGQQVLELTQREQEVLTAIAAKSPEVTQPAIRRALDVALRGQKIAQERLEDLERTKQQTKGEATPFGQDEPKQRPALAPGLTSAVPEMDAPPEEKGESTGGEGPHEGAPAGALAEHPSVNQNGGHEADPSTTPDTSGGSVEITRGEKERTEQRDGRAVPLATPTVGSTPLAALPAGEHGEREGSHDRREVSTPETRLR